jgi:hypothetical protein
MIARILVFLFLASPAWASSVHIYVTDGKTKDCPPAATDPEETRYVLKSPEAAAALKRYVESKKNPKLYDAAFVNAGLKFCGQNEALAVFKALTDSLKKEEPTQRTWELIKNYKRDPSLLDAIEERLKTKKLPQTFTQNLLNARGMTVPKDFDPKKQKYH